MGGIKLHRRGNRLQTPHTESGKCLIQKDNSVVSRTYIFNITIAKNLNKRSVKSHEKQDHLKELHRFDNLIQSTFNVRS
jgi:hypothetical protein